MNIHEWIISNLGNDDDPAVQQAIFIRDRIGRALFPTAYSRDAPIEVVREHRSKSKVLPVCLAVVGGAQICFRNNWYNWAISVESNAPVDDVGGWGLFDESGRAYLDSGCMDGFEDAHVFGPYAADRRRFSCHVWGPDEVFWMFCRLLRGSDVLEARASVWDAIWAALWPRWSGVCMDCGDAVAVDDRRCHPCVVEAMVRASRETRRALWGR